jgi:hypothetical protein
MFTTVEVRWFGRGPVPAMVQGWFGRCPGAAALQMPRVDAYLRATGGALGIKLRQGRLEIKLRRGELGVVQLHPGVAGRVERWAKWSFPLAADGGEAFDAVRSSPAWMGVHKARALRAYTVAADGTVEAVPAGQLPPLACSFELTRVRAGDGIWWTLGFEGVGDDARAQERFFRVVGHVLQSAEPPRLEAADSYGYAAWLGGLG